MKSWLLGEWSAAMWLNALAWGAAWLMAITVLVLFLDRIIPE